MAELDFSTHYEQTLLAVEEAVEAVIDNNDADIDFESVNDILTLTCPDGSSIIITRQSATKQLWLAAKSGGFHFDLQNNHWVCDADGEKLPDKLTSMCLQQANVQIDFFALNQIC
ncbi:MAG: iron donor protein CyaY [Gammaproteobacteria bacterium]|nr:iron donor protein CyaY [Gammaproteobacteria bacterium]